MKPYSRSGKGGITTMIEMPLNQLPATVDRASIELKSMQPLRQADDRCGTISLGGLSYNIPPSA